MSVAGNIFRGVFEGVKTHVANIGQEPVKPKEEPKFPTKDDEDGGKGMEVEIFGLKPLNFGLVALGLISASVIAVVLYKKYGK